MKGIGKETMMMAAAAAPSRPTLRPAHCLREETLVGFERKRAREEHRVRTTRSDTTSNRHVETAESLLARKVEFERLCWALHARQLSPVVSHTLGVSQAHPAALCSAIAAILGQEMALLGGVPSLSSSSQSPPRSSPPLPVPAPSFTRAFAEERASFRHRHARSGRRGPRRFVQSEFE